MSSTPPTLPNSTIENAVKAAVPSVCRKMLNRDASYVGTAQAEEAARLTFGVVGHVGFTGHANGMLFLCLPSDFAREATATVLGISVPEVDYQSPDVLKDAICEVTNMMAGSFRNVLSSLGFSCRLTPPTLARGEQLRVPTAQGATRHPFRFQCGDHAFVTEIQLRPADS